MNFLIVCLILGILNNANAANNGNCELEGVEDINWVTAYTNEEKNDDERTEFKRFKASNIEGVTPVDPAVYFSVKLEDGFLIISPSQEFENYETIESSDSIEPTLVLNLIFVCTNGTADLAFYQPIKDLNTFEPKFSKDAYSYTLPMPLPGDFDMQCLFGDPIEACDSDITNTQVDFAIEPPEDFSIVWGDSTDDSKCHKALIKTQGPVRLTSDKEYTLRVIDRGSPTKSGTAKLQIGIDEQTAIPPNPQFTSAYYTATYDNANEQHTIDVPSTITLQDNNPKVHATLIGEHKDNFDMQLNDGTISITLKTNLAEDVINDNVIVLLTIEATLEQAEGPGRTVLIVYLPKKECPQTTTPEPTTCPAPIICPMCTTEAPTTQCPPCPTTESTSPATECPSTEVTTECPPCSTTTTPPTDPTINFEQETYIFNVPSKDDVTVGIVKAVPTISEVIEYSLQASPDSELPGQLQIGKNDGILTVNQKLDVGVYQIIVNAKGITSNARDEANVLISIYQLETTDSVIVRQVDEESEGSIPIPCPEGDNTCTYEFVEQYPPTDQQLFTYQNGRLHSKKLSLQMAEIKDLLVPQFTVVLKLVSTSRNVNSSSITRRDLYADEDIRRWVYLPENLTRIPDTLLVSVIINDVNNHKPEFAVANPLIVGYPTRTLSNQLSPPHLVQVNATDLDTGAYADIRYSTTSTHFVIHPKSGVIYPAEDAFEDGLDQTLTIIATDMDGAGLSSTLEIEVKLLQAHHLTVLEIKNRLLEDLDDIIKELSQETHMKINYLTAAVVPSVATSTYTSRMGQKIKGFFKSMMTPRDDSDHLIKLVIYALDGSNEPVEANDLQTSLEGVQTIEDISVDDWEPAEGSISESKTIDTTGFIAAIAVLGSLLGIFIIAVALVYFLKIRKHIKKPEPYETMDEEDTRSITFEKSEKPGPSEDIGKRRPTGFVFNPPPIENDEDDETDTRNLKYVKPVEITSTSNLGWQGNYGSSTSYAEPIDYERGESSESRTRNESSDYEDITELKDLRKSVSFLPTVQKINIVVEDEKHAEDDTEDNDKNIDVRL